MTATPEMLVGSERAVRRALVTIEHMNSENTQEWDRTIKTFSHARYELPDGRTYDGRDDVMAYWVDGRTAVPDQRNELISDDDCAIGQRQCIGAHRFSVAKDQRVVRLFGCHAAGGGHVREGLCEFVLPRFREFAGSEHRLVERFQRAFGELGKKFFRQLVRHPFSDDGQAPGVAGEHRGDGDRDGSQRPAPALLHAHYEAVFVVRGLQHGGDTGVVSHLEIGRAHV